MVMTVFYLRKLHLYQLQVKQDVACYVVLRIPHSFICKSHGKQEVDVQSFLPVEAEISTD